MIRIGASVGREPVSPAVLYIAVQTNVARNAFRAATTISQYVASVQPNLLWNQLFVTNFDGFTLRRAYIHLFYLPRRFRSARGLQGPRKFTGFRLSEDPGSVRGPFGARIARY